MSNRRLPPTIAQTEKYLADTSPNATERVVDELLGSPRFGERWGRHWLDLVRYAESRGHEFDNDAPNASQYRDYVIRAFNADVPYDQFVREHIAGDLLEKPRLHPDRGFNESILGTGFWFLGEWVHSPVDIRKDEADRFDNMIDVMSKTFLGMTAACARCHDHKFDAISTADYYSLSGFLQSSDFRQVRFESMEHNNAIHRKLMALDDLYQKRLETMLAEKKIVLPKRHPIPKSLQSSIVVDYASTTKEEYRQDGFLFGGKPVAIGDARPVVDGSPGFKFQPITAGISDPFWNGLVSLSGAIVQDRSALSKLPRSGRTLRTPTFNLTAGRVDCYVLGAGHVVACVDSHRLIAGPLHKETIQPIKAKVEWTTLDLSRYVGHRVHLEFTPAEGSQLEVRLITQGATAGAREELSRWMKGEETATAKFEGQVSNELGEPGLQLAKAWADDRELLRKQVMHRSHLAMAMMDGTGEDDRVLIRGNSAKPGDVEPRHFLTAVSGNKPMSIPSGSGRLELARHINDPANPLTARVIVNRLWHHLMGRGIVPTTDDFGVLGQRPTHPQLLDFLATKFIADGRSIKRMIRTIVLSRAYRMSGPANPAAVRDDPVNLLWHHRPPKRLEGEAIRDALLAISGRLDPRPFGESVPTHLTPFMDGRGRPGKSGPLDGDGRRSIYLGVRRNFLSPFMLVFDTPVPFSTMGRRNVSNVPAQALILMNDPLVVELSERWGRLAIKAEPTAAARIEWMYRTAFGRPPTARELAIVKDSMNGKDTDQAWVDLANFLVNTKEFIFLK